MNQLKSLISLLSLAAVASFGAATAQAETTILTVSVDRAANEYYKVVEFKESLQQSQEQAQQKVRTMNEEGKALQQEYQELVEQVGSELLSEEGRKEAEEDARLKYQEIAQKQAEIQQFLEGVQRSIQSRMSSQMTLFTKDIVDVINEIAAEKSATVVLDTSGATRNGMPPVLYATEGIDITDDVITRINATQGEEAAEEGE